MTGRRTTDTDVHEFSCQKQQTNSSQFQAYHQQKRQQQQVQQQQVISATAPSNGSGHHDDDEYSMMMLMALNNDTDTNFGHHTHEPVGGSLAKLVLTCLAHFPVYGTTVTVALLYALYTLATIFWRQFHARRAYDADAGELARLPLPPGSVGVPFIGETWNWLRNGAQFNSSRRKQYGNVFKTNVLLMPMIKVTGHEFVSEILRGEHTKVTTIWPRSVQDILGEHGLVNSTSAIHRFKRRISSRAFTRDALDGYLVAMRDISARNVALMATYECPKVYDMMLRQTFDIAVNALLGLDIPSSGDGGVGDGVGDLDELYATFNDLVKNIFSIPYKIGLGYSKGMNARAKILGLLQGYIEKKKSWMREEMKKCGDKLLEEDGRKYIEGGSGAVDIIIREEMIHKMKMRRKQQDRDEVDDDDFEIDDLTMKEMAIELMFAGYFTSASAITSCILELAQHPEVFRKLECELQQFGLLNSDMTSSQDGEAAMDSGTINRMSYLDKVVKETLRVKPPVLGAYRRAMKTFQIGDYRIPKGWVVIYNIRDTHEFESGDEVEKFDPENFEKTTNGPKHSYIPFGGGSRMCIGQEYARLIIKVTIINMIRHYRKWELVSTRSLDMTAIPTLHPKDGFPVRLFPRTQNNQQQQS